MWNLKNVFFVYGISTRIKINNWNVCMNYAQLIFIQFLSFKTIQNSFIILKFSSQQKCWIQKLFFCQVNYSKNQFVHKTTILSGQIFSSRKNATSELKNRSRITRYSKISWNHDVLEAAKIVRIMTTINRMEIPMVLPKRAEAGLSNKPLHARSRPKLRPERWVQNRVRDKVRVSRVEHILRLV